MLVNDLNKNVSDSHLTAPSKAIKLAFIRFREHRLLEIIVKILTITILTSLYCWWILSDVSNRSQWFDYLPFVLPLMALADLLRAPERERRFTQHVLSLVSLGRDIGETTKIAQAKKTVPLTQDDKRWIVKREHDRLALILSAIFLWFPFFGLFYSVKIMAYLVVLGPFIFFLMVVEDWFEMRKRRKQS